MDFSLCVVDNVGGAGYVARINPAPTVHYWTIYLITFNDIRESHLLQDSFFDYNITFRSEVLLLLYFACTIKYRREPTKWVSDQLQFS